jgi:hypothetical protein
MNLFDQLAAPFDPSVISWRAQSLTQDKSKAMALAYIDARDVMRRLDEVCGPANWQCRYPHATTKTICEIGIKHDGEWIWKANGAGDTDIEAEKGAISDAFKRSAVLWGIGRYLYDMPSVWAGCEVGHNGKWKAWTPAGLNRLTKAAQGHVPARPKDDKPDPNSPITDTTRDHIASKIDAAGVAVGDVCREFGVSSLKELKFSQARDVLAWIEQQRKAA